MHSALRFACFDGLPVDVAVSTREGGVSSGPYRSLNLGLHVGDDAELVVENRRRAAALVGADAGDLVFCQQAHDRNVVLVGDDDRGRGLRDEHEAVPATDALVTTTPGPALVAMVADCVPIALYEPAAHVLACVHAGWRGTVADVVGATVEHMATLGADPAEVRAGVGPCIGAAAYQVGPEVRDAAETTFGPAAEQVAPPDGTGRWTFDLHRANRLLLERAGVAPDHIEVSTATTDGDPRLFSDRAERPCGRFAVLGRLLPR